LQNNYFSFRIFPLYTGVWPSAKELLNKQRRSAQFENLQISANATQMKTTKQRESKWIMDGKRGNLEK